MKSGWAAVVLLTGTARSPKLSDVGRIELCDPQNPETRQPYHAAMGKHETNPTKLNQRKRVVRNVSRRSLAKLLNGYQKKDFRIKRAALVVGSRIDPATIANLHIRAHALEGCLFRFVIEEALQDRKIRTELLLERGTYASVSARLNRSSNNLKRWTQDLRRSGAAMSESWRAEEKLAALAALFVL